MKKTWPLLILMFLFTSGVSTTAVFAQKSGSPVSQTSNNTASQDTQDGDELRTQQEIAVENKRLRAENAGLKDEVAALKGQVTVLTRTAEVERERGDWFKDAATKGQKLDSNSGLIVENLNRENKVCMAQVSDLERENDKLRSSRNWRTILGFGAGAAAGAYAARR